MLEENTLVFFLGGLVVGAILGCLIFYLTMKKKTKKVEWYEKKLHAQEKLADLNLLMAGIVHDVKSPLHFIYNFSRISSGQLVKLGKQLEDVDDPEVQEIIKSLKVNLDKIEEYVDNINMTVQVALDTVSSKPKLFQSTDINQLVQNVTKLCKSGFKSEQKGLTVNFESSYDENLKKISVVPHMITQVLTNLFVNAYQSLNAKRDELGSYDEPNIKVTTKDLGDNIEVTVEDNGLGISKKDIRKIFDPLFSTKPASEGTGLGLAISRDIISKLHEGELSVESEENHYAKFIISLPKN